MTARHPVLYPGIHRIASILLAALLVAPGCTTTGGFQVSGTAPGAERPAVAYSPDAKEFLVVYLRQVPGSQAKQTELRLQRFDETGKALGQESSPFGATKVLGRPALAYGAKDKRYLLAAPTLTAGGHSVALRFLDTKGAPVGQPQPLFGDQAWTYYDGDGVGSLHVTWNSALNEFLVTLQRTVQGTYNKENGIWAQRVSQAGGQLGKPVQLLNTTVHGIDSHAVAYAPLGGPGGRYLFAFSGGGAVLLDANAKSVAGVPLDLGEPAGGNTHPDAAFGTVDGKQRYLLVYSDEDNCKPGLETCTALEDQWSGVWGLYIDPVSPSSVGSAFPISKIWAHVANRREYKPQVAYQAAGKRFFVAWREVPTLNQNNEESRSHIRGNWIDYLVPGGLAGTTQVPSPPDNVVVSTSTGSCTKADAMCQSAENPVFPDTAATANGAVVVWQQNSPPNAAVQSIVGRVLTAP